MKKGVVLFGCLLLMMTCVYAVQKPQFATELSAEEMPIETQEFAHEYQPVPVEMQGIYAQLEQQASAMALDYGGGKVSRPMHIVNPVVFIELRNSDGSYDDDWITPANLAKAEALFNSGQNSLRNYIKKISYGMVDVETVFYPRDNNGTVTSVKSPFYKSFLEPATVNTSTNTDLIPNLGYDPSLGDVIGSGQSINSFRSHEYFVYNYALKDTASGGGGVASQIAADYQGNDYLKLNSLYTALNAFSMWDDEFSWIGTAPGDDHPTWPEFFKNWEMISTDTFTFVLNADDSQQKRIQNGKEVTHEVYWPHQYAWSMSGGLLKLTDRIVIPGINSSGGYALPLTYVNNAITLSADQQSGIFADNPNVGVVAHEFLHTLGAPEMYRMSYKGQAVGKWDIMGQQMSMPQYPLQFVNQKYGIWETPSPWIINSTMSRDDRRTNLEIFPPTYSASDDKTSYKIYPADYFTSASKHEYFMVEYRTKASSGFESSIPNEGLLVYRVRDNVSNQYNGAICGLACGNAITFPDATPPSYDEVFVYRPNVTDPTLLNQGSIDANLDQATLPRTENGVVIDHIGTVPSSSNAFDPDSLYYSDGTNSGVRIVDIKKNEANNSMNFTVLYGDEGEAQDFAMELADGGIRDQHFYSRKNSTLAQPIIDLKHSDSTTYTLSITEVKRDDSDLTSQQLFSFDQQSGTNQAIVSPAAGGTLEVGTYTIALHAVDEHNQEAVLTIQYTVLPEFPTQEDVNASYTLDHLTLSSNHEAGDVIGQLLYDGKSYQEFDERYHVISMFDYTINPAHDYEKYFELEYSQELNSVVIKVKERIPDGSYELNLTLEYYDRLTQDSDGTILTKKVTLVVGDNNGGETPPDSAKPTISDPSGAVLTTQQWMKGVQMVDVTVADDVSLKSVVVTSQNGAFYVNDQVVSTYQSTYDVTTKTDTLQLPVYANGTYTITVTNTHDQTETKAFTISKLDNTKPGITIAMQGRTASVSATDQDSLIDTISYVKTSDTTTAADALSYTEAYTSPVTIEDAFAGRFCVKASDHAGNTATACETINALVPPSDTTPPVIAVPTLTPNTWTNDTVTMTVSLSDNDAVVSLQVTTDDGELSIGNEKKKTHTYALTPAQQATQTVVLTKNGTYTLTARDQSGNTTDREATIKLIDTDGPLLTLNVGAVQADQSATITISASDLPAALDLQSGVKEIKYQFLQEGSSIVDLQEDDWVVYTAPIQRQNAQTDNGKICAKAYDHAGNGSQIMCKPFHGADNDAPEIANTIQGLIDINENPNGWTNAQALTLQFHVTEQGSGIHQITLKKGSAVIGTPYVNDGATPVLDETYTGSVNENAEYTLYVTDHAGNTATKTFTVNQFDRMGPVIDGVALHARMMFFLFPTEDSMLDITAHDLPTGSNSGIKEYRYTIGTLSTSEKQDDSAWKVLPVGETLEIKGEDTGILYLYAYDNAGNRSALHEQTIDREGEAPSLVPELQSLTPSVGTLTPAFSKDVYTYRINVAHTTSSITLQAQAADASFTLTGDVNRSLSLEDGDNNFEIQVSGLNTMKTYTITVHRQTATEFDAHLSSLTPSTGTLSPAFASNILTYTMSVPNNVKQLTLRAQANSATAEMDKDVNTPVALVEGTNTLEVRVRDGKQSDGSYTQELTYTVSVIRLKAEQDHDATLKSITSSKGTLSPAFSPSTTEYNIKVPNDVASIKLTATANSAKATVSGDAGKTKALAVGENNAQIICTAEDGTKKTYTLHITREASEQKNPQEPSDAYEIKDASDTIHIIGSFDDTFKVISKVLDDVELNESWSSDYDLLNVFDIYLEKDGRRFTIDETVTVRITRTDEWKQMQNLGVVYIADDGTITGMPTTVYDEYIEFTTDHFSRYAVVSKKQNSTSGGAATGDTNHAMEILLIASCALCVMGGLIIRKRNQNNIGSQGHQIL